MRRKILATLGVLLPVIFAHSVRAGTVVSTIDGFYGGDFPDTSWLTITNSTAYDFTSVQMVLTGYQGLNDGIVSPTVNLGTIAAGTTQTDAWEALPGVSGGQVPQNLTAGDYDDEYFGAFPAQTGYGLLSVNPDVLVPAPQCAAQSDITGWGYCADVGNFYVTITATWNNPAYGVSGTPIYALFSPGEDPFGIGNACGNTAACFIGWEGLDPNGWSETVYDDHSSGGPGGILANIYVGTAPPIAGPEPGTLVLLGSALGLIGLLRRKRV
jgi:hypothetical protein